MDLENALKQVVENKTEENIQQIETQDTKIQNANKDIYLVENDAKEKQICLNFKYESSLAEDLRLLEEVQARISKKKEDIIKFIEENNMGSFKGNLLNVKYTSATTTTSIDTTRLKKELPDIAAKYSKVSSRKSSVSIDILDMPKLSKDLL